MNTHSSGVLIQAVEEQERIRPEGVTHQHSATEAATVFLKPILSNRFGEPETFPNSTLEITAFSPEPYKVKYPISVSIVQSRDDFIASHHETNIHASGDNEFEAMENLKSLLLDTFEILSAEPEGSLGGKAKNQLAVLRELIEPI